MITSVLESVSMNQVLCQILFCLLTIFNLPQEPTAVLGVQRLDPARKDEVKSRVEQLINSSSSQDLAWAAYLIGQHEMKELAPTLIDLLDSSPPDGWEWILKNIVLDSLIRLQITVSSDKVLPLYERFPDQVLIIMARAPAENGDALLSIAQRSGRTVCWVMACNLLAETRAPGFAEFLLRSLEIELNVVVSDKGGVGSGRGSGFAIGCGASGQYPDGFPPIAIYRLIDEPKRDAVVIAPGPHPVFYEREVYWLNSTNQRSGGSRDQSVDRNLYRMEYLAFLLNKGVEELKLKNFYHHTIIWAGSKHYTTEVMRLKESIIKDFEHLKTTLVERELLSESEAEGLAPNLILTELDFRQNKSSPLPEVPGLNKRE
jgi:hypothetical protein